ncbi:Fe-Mn family superoxide dismutase [Achromobacter aegrifaciens]
MELMAKPFLVDSERISGLSGLLVRSHYDNNYLGALARLNTIRKKLEESRWESTPAFLLIGAKREELLAANSVFLHEAYFEVLGGDGAVPAGGLSVALERDFGSVDQWRAEFTSLARAMSGGSGWAILAWSSREARLVNHWAGDHTQLLAGASTLLALDMYEHAYHMDFGAKAAAYIDAFMAEIQWDVIASRYARAIDEASLGLGIQASEAVAEGAIALLDVRRRPVFSLSGERIAGSEWQDPAQATEWMRNFDNSGSVVVYCVHGREVSQGIALALNARGIPARYLVGGIEAWREAGLAMAPLAPGLS